jgi:hypothetical protein
MGGVFGLDYPGVKTVLDLLHPHEHHSELFTAIQVMERAAMDVLNSKLK